MLRLIFAHVTDLHSFHQTNRMAARPSEIIEKDLFEYEPMDKINVDYQMVDGVFTLAPAAALKNKFVECAPKSAEEFFTDLHHICKVSAIGPVKTFCHQRLLLLEQKFNLHVMMNADKEYFAQKSAPHRDFYNVRKVMSDCTNVIFLKES